MNKSGLKPKADVVQDLKLCRIQRDNIDLNKLIDGIGATIDPYLVEFRDESLYCISTGKVIPADTAESILSTQTQGQKWHEEFKTGCFANSDRFEKPIPRRKVKSFACITMSVKLQLRTGK